MGKIFTQRIERHNLTLRTRIKRLARKSIYFSKSIEIHEKVMGAYLDKFHYQLIRDTTENSFYCGIQNRNITGFLLFFNRLQQNLNKP